VLPHLDRAQIPVAAALIDGKACCRGLQRAGRAATLARLGKGLLQQRGRESSSPRGGDRGDQIDAAIAVIVKGRLVAEEAPGSAADLEERFLRLVAEAELS